MEKLKVIENELFRTLEKLNWKISSVDSGDILLENDCEKLQGDLYEHSSDLENVIRKYIKRVNKLMEDK